MTDSVKKPQSVFPHVNENCIYCGLCAKKCPKGALTVDRKSKNWCIEKEKCILCGACSAVCKKNAIDMDKKARFEILSQMYPPVTVPLTKGVLVCEEQLCAGCMNCMFACTLNKEGVTCFDLARIQMNVHTQAEFHIAAQPCQQCADPQCMRYCPVKAITVDEQTGARVVDENKCIGCKTCIDSCPYEIPRIRFDKEKKVATKCDLCGGDPACVKMCPSGALQYITNEAGIQTGCESVKGD